MTAACQDAALLHELFTAETEPTRGAERKMEGEMEGEKRQRGEREEGTDSGEREEEILQNDGRGLWDVVEEDTC